MTAPGAAEPAPQLPVVLLDLDRDGQLSFANVVNARTSGANTAAELPRAIPIDI